ncbi:MAG: hypothetical protein AAGC93_15255 [Cyanobacteria bacterium P01_F01_bin.53]
MDVFIQQTGIGLKVRKVGYVPGKAATPAKMAEQATFQKEELESRLAEAKAGERAVFMVTVTNERYINADSRSRP